MKKFFFILITLLVPLVSTAKPLDQTANLWLHLTFKGAIDSAKNWLYQAELQTRFIFEEPVYDRNVLRFGFGRVMNNRASWWFGYDVTTFLNSSERLRLEQRIWPQLLLNLKNSLPVTMDSRTRLELRYQNQNPQIAWRLRQKLTTNFKMNAKQFFVPVIFDEIFFNLNHPDWVSTETVEQNRLLFGFSYPIKEKVSLITGYLNRVNFNTTSNQMQNVIYFEFTFE